MSAIISRLILWRAPALEYALAVFWALALARIKPLDRPKRALSLCAAFGLLSALISREGWNLAVMGALFLLLGAAIWLLFRPPALYAAAAAVLSALLLGISELLYPAAGSAVLLGAALLLALCCWQKVAILPDTPEVLAASDRRQARKFYSSTAVVLVVLLLPTLWVWYLLAALDRLPVSEHMPVVLFSVSIAGAVLLILRQLAFDAVQRIEAVIDKQYQTELLNLMQIIRSQRHDFNFHIQAISGMIEQEKYAECTDYVRTMVKTTNAMNDMLPLHDPAVSAMINSFRELAAQKGIELRVAISDDLAHIPCTVYEINTVIGNLIQNAVDEVEQNTQHSPQVNVLILKRGGNHIIKVTNPCSLAADTFRDCFKPGYTTKQSHEGIGLATVMRIVTKYHGAVFPEFFEGFISFVVQLPCSFE